MATQTFKNAAGVDFTAELPPAPGRAAASASRPVVLSNEDAAYLDGIEGLLTTIDGRVDGLETLLGATNTKLDSLIAQNPSEYEMVAASQTDQVLGATGAVGDKLLFLLIIPETTSPGAVSIKDGNGSAITVFAGGTLGSVIPFSIPLNGLLAANATTPGWKVTTGANVHVMAVGNFT